MNAQRITWQVRGRGPQPKTEDAINMFHGWIQSDRVGTLLLDVHDYTHVPKGPGVILVADEAHYRIEQGFEEWGFSYLRKRRLEGDFAARLSACLGETSRALRAAREDLGIEFDATQWTLRLEDRLLFPTESDYSELLAELNPVVAALLGIESAALQGKRVDASGEALSFTFISEIPIKLDTIEAVNKAPAKTKNLLA